MRVTIYHNPNCGTSRNVLAIIREHGVEPEIIEYLKHPPSRARLKELIAAMGLPVRAVLRTKNEPYTELGLADAKWSDDALVDFMIAHPDEAGDIVAKAYNIESAVGRAAVKNLTTSKTAGIPYWGPGTIHKIGRAHV